MEEKIMEKEIENNVNETTSEEIKAEPIVALEYDLSKEEATKSNKFIIKYLYGFHKWIVYIVNLILGILFLLYKNDDKIRTFVHIVGWFEVILCSLILLVLMLIFFTSLHEIKHLDETVHVKYNFYEDEFNVELKTPKSEVKTSLAYKEFKMIVVHDEWVFYGTNTNNLIIKAGDKKEELIGLLLKKNPKIKVKRK